MGRSEREKGKRGEREVVQIFRASGIAADRTAPLQAGCDGEADVRVAIPGLFLEVKRQETLRIPEWMKILEQACPPDRDWVLAFRRNGDSWKAVVPLEWLASLLAEQQSNGHPG